MIDKIKRFLKPDVIIYNYHLPKEIVISKVETVLNRKMNFVNDVDIYGSFISANKFKYDLQNAGATNGGKYSSTMYGSIREDEKNLTKVVLTPKSSITVLILFFVSFLIALIFLVKCFIEPDWGGFVSFLFFLLLLPSILMMISGASISALTLRYKTLIDKQLR